ncbi:hypothetical protein HD554DRAFT_2039738 [Boletus coccyginus]|nr:hypothetical protein HD554DRAFT_2039738 [Boletus coccyginus]
MPTLIVWNGNVPPPLTTPKSSQKLVQSLKLDMLSLNPLDITSCKRSCTPTPFPGRETDELTNGPKGFKPSVSEMYKNTDYGNDDDPNVPPFTQRKQVYCIMMSDEDEPLAGMVIIYNPFPDMQVELEFMREAWNLSCEHYRSTNLHLDAGLISVNSCHLQELHPRHTGIYQHKAIQQIINEVLFKSKADKGIKWVEYYNLFPHVGFALTLTAEDQYKGIFKHHLKMLDYLHQEKRKMDILTRMLQQVFDNGRLHAGINIIQKESNRAACLSQDVIQDVIEEFGQEVGHEVEVDRIEVKEKEREGNDMDEDVEHPEVEIEDVFGGQICVHVIKILLNGDKAFNDYPYHSDPLLQHKPWQKLAASPKTKQYHLRTSTIDESSVSENIAVINDIYISQLL